ncbi:protease, putative [uncultured Candidatus Thioglobus sp.]|nr:protease, putative [uncultured Candidatus Thioglobus sp.]
MQRYPINYQITPKNIHAHIFRVRLTLDSPNPLGQVFTLPNWIPGSYLIRDFAKHIVSIEAHSGDTAVPIKKIDKNHWITQPCDGQIVVSYEIYAFDLSVRCAYLTNERAFFNGSSVFLQPIGFDNHPCAVQVDYPTENTLGDWSCATALTLKEKQQGFEVYTADNYQTLIDCPVEMADFTRFEFSAGGVPHTMTITGQHSTDIAQLRKDLMRICQHHIDFFGDIPFDNYLFLTLATAKDYGGLEHKNSTSLICSREELLHQNQQKYTRFLSLCAHEYFHAWWIKTIKPASFHTMDMGRENYTEQLWIFEGFTSYYDEFSLLRAGLLSIEQYLILFAQTLSKVQQGRGRYKQSIAESSFDAWTKFYQQDENAPNTIVSYYTKGASLAFVLDIEIRKRSDDKCSLDNVLQLIWQKYQNSGLEDDTVQKVVEHLTQSDFSQFFTDYLYGIVDLPLTESFAYIGVNCTFSHKQGDLSNFGIGVNKTEKYAIISHIFDGTCAQAAGLYVKDKIISIDSINVPTKDLVNAINACVQGDSIKIGILRDELPQTISLTITHSENTHCTLTLNQNADKITLQRQEKWLKGKN